MARQHVHSARCYGTTLLCAKREHTHVNRACYYQKGPNEGNLKCSTTEHSHGNGCYGATGPHCGHD